MGKGIVKSSGGYTPSSAAPNVTATCTVSLALSSLYSVAVFGGNITLPGTLGTLDHINLILTGPGNATGTQIASIPLSQIAAAGAGGTIPYSVQMNNLPQTLSAQNGFAVQFVCYNTAGVPTASPYAVSSLSIPAASVAIASITDATGSRWQDPNTGALHAVEQVAITCANYPQWVDLWSNSPQYGQLFHGTFPILAPTTLNIGAQNSGTTIYPPTATASETVTFYAAIPQGVAYSNATTPTAVPGYVSAAVSVAGPPAPTSTAASSASITSGHHLCRRAGRRQLIFVHRPGDRSAE